MNYFFFSFLAHMLHPMYAESLKTEIMKISKYNNLNIYRFPLFLKSLFLYFLRQYLKCIYQGNFFYWTNILPAFSGKKSDQPMTDRPLWPFDFKLAAFIRIENRERLLLATNSRPKFSALKLGWRIEIFLSNEGTMEGKIPHSRNPIQIIFLFNKH